MPTTELDRLVPFQPGALFLYLTLWLYVGAGPGLQLRWRELVSYAAWSVLLCAAGLSIFYLWLTRIPSPSLDVSAHVGFAMLQGIDAAGNACPSMHVAFASFTAIRFVQVLRASLGPSSPLLVSFGVPIAEGFDVTRARSRAAGPAQLDITE